MSEPTTPPDADAETGGHPDVDELASTPRHFVQYAFLKVDRAWRRLAADERESHKEELAGLLGSWGDRIMVRTFSTVGIRPDADLMIWRATPDLDELHRMHAEILGTGLGAWLDTTYLYTSTTKPSQYLKDVRSVGFKKPRPLDVIPVDRRYMLVYPFVKQRRWYSLSPQERGAAMREHATIGRKYPNIKLNTSYSFGLDDQEFMTAFETDDPHDFLDLMMELRGTTASQYTERDTPIFTCILASPREVLDALDGTRAAVLEPAHI